MNASLLGQQVARHILLGDVKMQLMQDMLTMRLAIDFGQDILWKGVCSCALLSGSSWTRCPMQEPAAAEL